ncbi:1-deoxy-D-xylulose-5-phosphate synthase [Streptomyces sp. NBC_01304]|uniref:1-deoxy-D-xylulose-5-phosphate synthase n=1 Tax=Streptomyces sp. NBC_01304 TaxID=2903818 RepID=UPI002E151CBF|nr:1-deoxy-D-xylulose-5-phosphate synthase [Streptomyces sp. NBC_01304]
MTAPVLPPLSGAIDPKDLRELPDEALDELAAQIREFLIEKVSAVGGHLGPNLGAVELTMALHRVFDSPHDTLLFDTGHQSYVHKILTGRSADFDQLRLPGGLSGYPCRAESDHDVIENSHASTALAYADGLAKARQLTGESERAVVAVIGDGAMTGGMAWEALNNLGGAQDRPVIVVLNDNERSYAPTIGGLADHLQELRGDNPPEDIGWLLEASSQCAPEGVIGPMPMARSLFELLGFAYLGPIDGHHRPLVEEALNIARDMRVPVVVHVVSVKGKGYAPAVADRAECMHAVGVIDPATGRARASSPSPPSWTKVFSEALTELGSTSPELVAITAAMPGPTGLSRFGDRFPERFYDVGIAEQHAVTSAAGLAMGGLHPLVAVYATFLGRAFDQVLMDVALHRLPVTFVLDRAGITGPDGPSHHGMWDLTILGAVPGMRVAVPRDALRLRELLAEAVAHSAGPTALRFPKATAGPDIPALERIGPVDILHSSSGIRDVLLIPIGPLAVPALAAAHYLSSQGIGTTVADPRWALPVPAELTFLAGRHRLVVTVEDNTRAGGVGTAVARALADTGSAVPVRALGLPGRFIPHGARTDLLAAAGLNREGIVQAVLRARAGLPHTDAQEN